MSKAKEVNGEANTSEIESKQSQMCGIVMPISAIDGCTESHWSEVREIITQCIEEAGFVANLVSNSDEIGVIQKRIIQNLYENPIIVCDVSGKNPNVMFELGLRLAFDRPTVIIKDNATSYSFDTSPIEHLEYPRDLRYSSINDFKKRLTEKIKNTYNASKNDPNYSTFLKHFGEFKVAKITTKEVAPQELVLDEVRSLRNMVYSILNERNILYDELRSNEVVQRQARINRVNSSRKQMLLSVPASDDKEKDLLISKIMKELELKTAGHGMINNGRFNMTINLDSEAEVENVRNVLKKINLPIEIRYA